MFKGYKHIHYIGIGGSGLSALAYLALQKGLTVSGSDGSASATTDDLVRLGATLYMGSHRAEHLPVGAEAVIYTEAIDKATNPEFLEAQRRGLPCLAYFEALGQMSREYRTVAVCGTHGKTTTTAMLGQALMATGLDPTVIVGTRVPAFGGRNLRVGGSPAGGAGILVAEACEYRRSFLHLEPFGVVLLNCEPDHLDYYKDEADYVSAFKALVAKIPAGGFLVANADDANVRKAARACRGKVIGVSMEEARGLELNMTVPGIFNHLNAAHALQAALTLGAEEPKARAALEAFAGTARRMEVKGEKNGVLLIDDYAHHPTEIRATLRAIKERYPGRRVVCVFQPHQHSRTRDFLDAFAKAFADADVVMVSNIFEARDSAQAKADMPTERLVEVLRQNHPHVEHENDVRQMLDNVRHLVQHGDILITLGAGDINKILPMF